MEVSTYSNHDAFGHVCKVGQLYIIRQSPAPSKLASDICIWRRFNLDPAWWKSNLTLLLQYGQALVYEPWFYCLIIF